jgi:hypothetical protein
VRLWETRAENSIVMPGLDPGIHLLLELMDCGVKPGNDGRSVSTASAWMTGANYALWSA